MGHVLRATGHLWSSQGRGADGGLGAPPGLGGGAGGPRLGQMRGGLLLRGLCGLVGGRWPCRGLCKKAAPTWVAQWPPSSVTWGPAHRPPLPLPAWLLAG